MVSAQRMMKAPSRPPRRPASIPMALPKTMPEQDGAYADGEGNARPQKMRERTSRPKSSVPSTKGPSGAWRRIWMS